MGTKPCVVGGESAGGVAAGVPLGEADYVRGQTAALSERHAAVHEACESLRDTQAAYLLLRYSLSQRIVHWLGLVGSTMSSGAGGPSGRSPCMTNA